MKAQSRRASLQIDADAEGTPAWLLTYRDGHLYHVLLESPVGNTRAAVKEAAEFLSVRPREIQVTHRQGPEMWTVQKTRRSRDLAIVEDTAKDSKGQPVKLLTVHAVDDFDPAKLADTLASWLNQYKYKVG